MPMVWASAAFFRCPHIFCQIVYYIKVIWLLVSWSFSGDTSGQTVVFRQPEQVIWVSRMCLMRHPSAHHITSSSLSQHNLLLLVKLNKIQKYNVPLCRCGVDQVHKVWAASVSWALGLSQLSNGGVCRLRKKVLNIECGFKYHAVSSFAHFIECTATQDLNIGLMPVAVFFPVYLFLVSRDVSCCSVVFLMLPLFMLTIIYYLIPFHYSFCFHLVLSPCCTYCDIYVVVYHCLILFLSVEFFCLPECHLLIPSPSHSKGKFTHTRLCLYKNSSLTYMHKWRSFCDCLCCRILLPIVLGIQSWQRQEP